METNKKKNTAYRALIIIYLCFRKKKLDTRAAVYSSMKQMLLTCHLSQYRTDDIVYKTTRRASMGHKVRMGIKGGFFSNIF